MEFDQWDEVATEMGTMKFTTRNSEFAIAEDLLRRGPQHRGSKPTKLELETHIDELHAELRLCIDIARLKIKDTATANDKLVELRDETRQFRAQYRNLWDAANGALLAARIHERSIMEGYDD